MAVIATQSLLLLLLLRGVGSDGAQTVPSLPQISMNGDQVCAVESNGGMRCAGSSFFGEMGLGTVDASYAAPGARLTVGGVPTETIAMSATGVCAILSTGALYCWGTFVGHFTPTQVNIPGNNVSSVALGVGFGCALTIDGTPYCFGENQEGQLGLGDALDRLAPAAVDSVANDVFDLAAGGSHVVALMNDGSLQVWGSNSRGQLGLGDFNSRLLPTPLASVVEPVAVIGAGNEFTCIVLLLSGDLQCFGGNEMAQLGLGTFTDVNVPTTVMSDSDVVQLALGYHHTCALFDNSSMACWGGGENGQTAKSDLLTRSRPSMLTNLLGSAGPIAWISAGDFFTMVLFSTGTLQAFGANDVMELTFSTLTDQPVPTTVTKVGTVAAKPIQVQGGGASACALLGDFTVQCWGDATNGVLGWWAPISVLTSIPVGGSAKSVGVGINSVCAVTVDGKLRCHGYNGYGQLGLGSNTDKSTPTLVTLPSRYLASRVVPGSYSMCVIFQNATNAGSLRCTGANGQAQLGLGDYTDRNTFVELNFQKRSVGEAALGAYHGIAMLEVDGSVWSWGLNENGQLGMGDTDERKTPTMIPNGKNKARGVCAGDSHTCVTLTDSTLQCFGGNAQGQLGLGDFDDRWSPTNLTGLHKQVATTCCGASHTCAALNNGSLVCFGANDEGQLGTTLLSGIAIERPRLVSLPGVVQAVYCGGASTCAVTTRGWIYCFGRNTLGELGLGDQLLRDVPTFVKFDATFSPTRSPTNPTHSPTRQPTTPTTTPPPSAATTKKRRKKKTRGKKKKKKGKNKRRG